MHKAIEYRTMTLLQLWEWTTARIWFEEDCHRKITFKESVEAAKGAFYYDQWDETDAERAIWYYHFVSKNFNCRDFNKIQWKMIWRQYREYNKHGIEVPDCSPAGERY